MTNANISSLAYAENCAHFKYNRRSHFECTKLFNSNQNPRDDHLSSTVCFANWSCIMNFPLIWWHTFIQYLKWRSVWFTRTHTHSQPRMNYYYRWSCVCVYEKCKYLAANVNVRKIIIDAQLFAFSKLNTSARKNNEKWKMKNKMKETSKQQLLWNYEWNTTGSCLICAWNGCINFIQRKQ